MLTKKVMAKRNENIIEEYKRKLSQEEIQRGIEIKKEVETIIENIIRKKEALAEEISRKLQILKKNKAMLESNRTKTEKDKLIEELEKRIEEKRKLTL